MSHRGGVMDPRTNVRDAVKHMVLLEEHLGIESKRCADCIRKHLLAIEAYGDECQLIDEDGEQLDACVHFSQLARTWLDALAEGADFGEVAQDIRTTRKELSKTIRTIPIVPTGPEIWATVKRAKIPLAVVGGILLGRWFR